MPKNSEPDSIYNILARIQEKHPWFWELKALISERPNMIPVGVGNNSTPINVALLQNSWDTSDVSQLRESSKDFDTQSEEIFWPPTPTSRDRDIDDEGMIEPEVDAEDDVDVEVGDEDGEDVQIGSKRKGKAKEEKMDSDRDSRLTKSVKVEKKLMIAPCPGKSTPAPTQKKTTKSAIEKFSEIALRKRKQLRRSLI
jgi:hypothetical protein